MAAAERGPDQAQGGEAPGTAQRYTAVDGPAVGSAGDESRRHHQARRLRGAPRRGAARPAGRAGRGADRGPRRRDQLRRPDGPRRASTRTRRRRRAWSATRSPARSRAWGRGSRRSRSATGCSPAPGSAATPSWSRVPVDQVLPLPDELSFEQGAAFPVNYGDRLRGAGDHGRPEARRAGADPRRGRRGRDRRDPGREGDRRRDLRHRLGLQARRDPRAGRRPPDRLPQPGLRRGGDADHRRRRRST